MSDGFAISPIGLNGLGSPSEYSAMFDSYMPYNLGMYSPSAMMNGYNIFGSGSGYDMSGYGLSGLNGLNNGYNMFGSGNGYNMAGLGMGGYGMGSYGMYNPAFMQQMQRAQYEMEKMSLDHANEMHNKTVTSEANAYDESLIASIRKGMANADIETGVYNLYNKVMQGDQNGICEEFSKLRDYILKEYKQQYKEKAGRLDLDAAVTREVERQYASIIGGGHELKADILAHGDGAFANGFLQGFREDHHEMDVSRTLNYIYGTRIDQYGAKEHDRTFGKVVGSTAWGLENGLIGAGGGIAGFSALASIYGGLGSAFTKKSFKDLTKRMFTKKCLSRAGWIGAITLVGYRLIARCLRNNKAEQAVAC
ncbi:MAG: hypothetical protein MJ237_05815 [bacterium]|nr:hypothetical protein [bacterium]